MTGEAAQAQHTPDQGAPDGPAPARPAGAPAARPRSGINWFRFWMQMLVAMVVFNILAGLFTWYVLFPILHPGR